MVMSKHFVITNYYRGYYMCFPEHVVFNTFLAPQNTIYHLTLDTFT